MIDFEKKGRAFTLAEVLITLSILGVVAAIMIPNLIQGYQQKLFATRLRQAYSILDNAFQQSIVINGHPRTWDISQFNTKGTYPNARQASSSNLMEKYIMPYVSVAKDCGYEAFNKCFAYDKSTHNGDGEGAIYYPFNGKYYKYTFFGNGDNKKIRLKNNISISYSMADWFVVMGKKEYPSSGYLGSFQIDVNGPNKPNKLGVDTFSISLYEDGLHMNKHANYSSLPDYCNKDSVKAGNGWGCSLYVLQTGKMDYLTKKLVCPEGKTTYPDCYYE